MSQRNSEYARQPRDLYETPAWVTEALMPHLGEEKTIWEPAAGTGVMAEVLAAAGHEMHCSDIAGYKGNMPRSFLTMVGPDVDAIVTNPPYGLAQKFVEHAIELMRPNQGLVAMLLPTDFDAAKGRRYLFGDCRVFKKKIILTRRIVWFKRTDGKKEAPSMNHCWMIWDWKNRFPPTIAYHYD